MSELTPTTNTDCCPTVQNRKVARSRDAVTDIFETTAAIHLEVDLPGLEESQIDVQVEEGVLSIHGENDKRRYRRSFQLPDGLELEKVSANLQHGVLQLTLPKAESAKPRKIEVKTAE